MAMNNVNIGHNHFGGVGGGLTSLLSVHTGNVDSAQPSANVGHGSLAG